MEKLFDIVHETDELLIVHKPADLVCHPTKGDEYSSLISRARLYLNAKSEPRLVNRLDRETSGLVLIAKNAGAARELGKLWEARAVQKEYLAIVHGHVAAEQGTIDAPLGRDDASPVAIKDCVRADGAAAQTEFQVLRRFSRSVSRGQTETLNLEPSAFSLLRLHPLTGRKHQIRLHLAHVGHPIVGDKLYGGDPGLYLALVEKRLTAADRARLILPHHALHAVRLQFEWRGQIYDFTAAPEPWFRQFAGLDEDLENAVAIAPGRG